MSGDRKFEVVLLVITREKLTVKVMDSAGASVAEEHRLLPNGSGTIDCVSGNFEDEPELPDGVFAALETIKGAGMEMMEQLARE